MDMIQVQCVLSLSQTLNFTQSALKLHISQSAFSRHIAALEQELGVTLFKRNTRVVELTSAGQLLLPEAEAIAAHYERAAAALRGEEGVCVGQLRIGILSDNTNRIAPTLVNQFRKRYPNITLVFREFNHASLLESLQKEMVDIAFISAIDTNNLNELGFETLLTCRNAVVMEKDHPLAQRDTLHIREIQHETFVLLDQRESSVIYSMTMQQCLHGGFVPMHFVSAKQIPSLLFMVASGQGVAVLPIDNRHFFSHGLRYVPLLEDSCRIKRLVAWRKSNRNISLPLFIKEVKTFCVDLKSDPSLYSTTDFV